jgi:hypothetical protein
LKPFEAWFSDIPAGSISPTFDDRFGFDAIFCAIGFSLVVVEVPGVVADVDVPDVDVVDPDVVAPDVVDPDVVDVDGVDVDVVDVGDVGDVEVVVRFGLPCVVVFGLPCVVVVVGPCVVVGPPCVVVIFGLPCIAVVVGRPCVVVVVGAPCVVVVVLGPPCVPALTLGPWLVVDGPLGPAACIGRVVNDAIVSTPKISFAARMMDASAVVRGNTDAAERAFCREKRAEIVVSAVSADRIASRATISRDGECAGALG